MLAFLFPGQGSQYPGMGRDVAETFPEAMAVFEEADRVLGFSLSGLCFEGPEEQLILTENTQPAILTTSVAIWSVLDKRGRRPDFVAGHSLGEFSALVAAGAMTFQDAVRLVRLRGRFMQEAVPPGQGAMAAVLGLELGDVEQICREAAGGDVVSPANINSLTQIVVAGHANAVERASHLAHRRGARKVSTLPVSAPFHCALMKPAQERLADVLKKTRLRDLRIPLVNNVDAAETRTADEVRDGLIRQVSSPVRWSDCLATLRGVGVTSFVEVGPRKVLTLLIRQTDRSARVKSIQNREQLEAYV
ncbi:MAG: ACP S-malonyltransferase [Acidobacteriota bacterium]